MNTMDNKGYNTLHTAALQQYPFILSMLASHKYEVIRNLYWDSNYLDRVTEDGANQTALHIACHNGDSDSVRVLLQYGANTDVRSNSTDTTLQITCESRDSDSVKMLPQYGANTAVTSNHTITALQIACRNEDKVIAQMLVKSGAEIHLLFSEMLFLYESDIAINNLQFNQAMACTRESVQHENEFESLLFLCLLKSSEDCPCDRDIQFPQLRHPVRCAYGLLRKCKKCLEGVLIKGQTIWRQATIGYGTLIPITSPSCKLSTIRGFDVVRYMCDTNVDMSEYVLDPRYHQLILNAYPRCSIRLLIRSYGMKNILVDQYGELIKCYWKTADYETVGLLYLSEYTTNPYKCLQLDASTEQDVVRNAGDPILAQCITKSTWIEKDMEGLTNLERLQYAAKQPRTLQNCCVINIRKTISSNVIHKAEKLPIPAPLKRAVVLDQIETVPCVHSKMNSAENFYTLY